MTFPDSNSDILDAFAELSEMLLRFHKETYATVLHTDGFTITEAHRAFMLTVNNVDTLYKTKSTIKTHRFSHISMLT